jgi:hypothetical protein
MQNDLLFNIAEQQYLEPPPARCPVCGSIDISASGVCEHCGTPAEIEIESEVQYFENPFFA